MLKTAFTFAFEDFTELESQIQFFAPLREVSKAFDDGYLKWSIAGLGEAYGFMFKLKSNEKPFIVKTLVNVADLDPDESIEWLIDSENLEVAQQVFLGLELQNITAAWEKEP